MRKKPEEYSNSVYTAASVCISSARSLQVLNMQKAEVYTEKINERGIKVYSETMVTDVSPDKTVTARSTGGYSK